MQTFEVFVDEAGGRAGGPNDTDHFVMSAVIINETDLPAVAAATAQLRIDLGRHAGQTLHFKQLKSPALRLHAATGLAAMPVHVSSVIVCKKHLPPSNLPDEHHAYLFTFRFLLERISWFARDNGGVARYTIAHVVRFKLAQLRHYEQKLREASTNLHWPALDSSGGSLAQPNSVEQLQLADIAASATYHAFESNKVGATERRYLAALAPVLYRRGSGAITTYGLKMHPWNDATRAAYPWVAAL